MLGPLFNAFAVLECISAVFGYVRDTSPGIYLFPRACGVGRARDKASASLAAVQCSSERVPRVIPQSLLKYVKYYKESMIQAYTGGSKNEQGFRSGAGVFIGMDIVAQINLKLDSSCSNNHAEQLAIIKALKAIGSIHTTEINPREGTIFTDKEMMLDSLKNANHTDLIDEIRKRVAILKAPNGK